MNKIQYKKREQFIQVAGVIAAHQDAVKSLPALESASKLFTGKIEQINQLAQKQLIGSRSATVAKRVARANMVGGVMDLVAKMTSYGAATGNLILLSEIKLTRSDLQYGRAATALFQARQIVAKARDIQPDLEVDYKLTTAVIDTVSNQVEDFGILIEAPGKAIDTRTVTTQTLNEVIAEASRILSLRIATQVTTLREAYPGFAQAFDQANVLEVEGSRASDSTSQPDPATPEMIASAPIAMVAAAPVPVVNAAAPANGNGRHSAPEPVAVDLAR